MTAYLVLVRDDNAVEGQDMWREFGATDARNDTEAIRSLADGTDHIENVYVAVPVRSWRPRRVRIETQTRLRLDQAVKAPSGEPE